MRRLVMTAAFVVLGFAQFNASSQESARGADAKELESARRLLYSTNPSEQLVGLKLLADMRTDARSASVDVVRLMVASPKLRQKATDVLDRINPEIRAEEVRIIIQGEPEDRFISLKRVIDLGDKGVPAIPAIQFFLTRVFGVDRPNVVRMLGEMGKSDPQLGDYLTKMAVYEEDALVRDAAIGGLAQQKNPKVAIEACKQLLTKADLAPEDQVKAITALATVGKGNEQAIKALEAMAQSDQADKSVKEAAQKALQKIKPK